MESEKLMELYGRRFTPFAEIAGFVLILSFALLITFGATNENTISDETPAIEQPLVD